MIKDYKKEELIEVIKKFKLELIAFELDIPIEELKKLEHEIKLQEKKSQEQSLQKESEQPQVLQEESLQQQGLQKESIQQQSTQEKSNDSTQGDNIPLSNFNSQTEAEKSDEKVTESAQKMRLMRKKYREIYENDNVISTVNQTEEEKKLVESTISFIEESIKQMSSKDQPNNKNMLGVMLKEIKKIKNIELTLSQAEKMYELLKDSAFENFRNINRENIRYYKGTIYAYRTNFSNKFLDAIDKEVINTSDYNRVVELSKKLKLDMRKINYVRYSKVQTDIQNKKTKLMNQRQKRVNGVVFPENVKNIAKTLSGSECDIEEIQRIIDENVRQKMDGKVQTRFTLTEEQEKERMLNQIMTYIRDYSNIENPESTLYYLEHLNGIRPKQALTTVVKNMINSKQYDKAEQICNSAINLRKHRDNQTTINDLIIEIRNSKFSDLVLMAIQHERNRRRG